MRVQLALRLHQFGRHIHHCCHQTAQVCPCLHPGCSRRVRPVQVPNLEWIQLTLQCRLIGLLFFCTSSMKSHHLKYLEPCFHHGPDGSQLEGSVYFLLWACAYELRMFCVVKSSARHGLHPWHGQAPLQSMQAQRGCIQLRCFCAASKYSR